MFFNRGTQVQCVNEKNRINYFFELAEGIELNLNDKFDDDYFQVVCLKPLKVIENIF